MVMRARAFNIEGKSGYTTVAVKMLKGKGWSYAGLNIIFKKL